MTHVTIKWFEGNYPSFNVSLHSEEGRPEFLTIKACRIMNGKDGPFVSYPATKNETSGKYWNHCWGSDQFNAKVLELAVATQPQSAPKPRDSQGGSQKPYQANEPYREEPDTESNIPF
jgi:hypothetical protein